MKWFVKIVLLSLMVFFLSWFVVFKLGINKLNLQSEDTIPALFLPVTVLKEGTFYIDSYYEMIREKYPHPDDPTGELKMTPFYLRRVVFTQYKDDEFGNTYLDVQPHYISAFPVISGLLAIPVYIIPMLIDMPITWENLTLLGHIAGALIIAFSGGFFFLLLKKHFDLDERKSLILTIVYLFGTINYALISQALWQHGSMQLFLILGLYFLFNAINEKTSDTLSQYFWAGLMFGISILSRPTSALSWIFIYVIIYFANQHSVKNLINRSLFYTMGLIPVAAFFMWYNQTYYLSINNQGYSDQLGDSWLGRFPEGFLGVWFSPSKGILIYSPVIVFSLIGLYLLIKNKHWQKSIHFIVFALIVLIHTLVIGKWKHWYGGWSFGYRMSADIIPYLVLLMIPYIRSDLFEKTKKIFFGLLVFSILVQIFGIIFFDGIWHAAYDGGYEDTGWLWSIKNSEFLFNIRRILVKLGLMEQACPRCLPG